MADKIKAIKIKQKNGTYSEEVPISVNVQNVQWDENNHTLLDALGSVDISSSGKGNLQHQIDELDGDKISTNEFNSRLNDFLKDQISADTTDWLDDNVNPVGSAVIVDKTLTIEGAAADAKVVGNRFTIINESLEDIETDLSVVDKYSILLNDEVPNTTQTYTFSNGSVSQVIHSRNNVSIRTDIFTYSSSSITEVRTLNTGESLTIVTNLITLETTISYSNH